MLVKYIGESCVSLTNGKLYEVISIEKDWYRIIDDTGEDYLFSPENFETVSANKKDIILLGQYEELAPGMGFSGMRDFLQDAPCEHQNAIVDYLNSGHIHMVTATTFTDVFSGERVKRELVYMDDGVYSWSSKLPYYVYKYNLRLPAAFEAHVLSQKQNLITELRKHMGEQATIVTQDHRTFSGKICDYFYPEDNECNAESVVLCVGDSEKGTHYIEFFEKEICRIYIQQ